MKKFLILTGFYVLLTFGLVLKTDSEISDLKLRLKNVETAKGLVGSTEHVASLQQDVISLSAIVDNLTILYLQLNKDLTHWSVITSREISALQAGQKRERWLFFEEDLESLEYQLKEKRSIH